MEFNKLMVALDLSKMDEKLIPYSAFISQIAGTKKVEFIHVFPSNIPPFANRDNPEIVTLRKCRKQKPPKSNSLKGFSLLLMK